MKALTTRLLTFLLLLSSAYANASEVTTHVETNPVTIASGVAISETLFSDNEPDSLRVGISFNAIVSNQALNSASNQKIFPVYAFARFQHKHAIAPYFEVGFDLGDDVINGIFGADNRDGDMYYAAGISFNLFTNMNMSLYYKNYELAYRTTPYDDITNVSLKVAGASVLFRF